VQSILKNLDGYFGYMVDDAWGRPLLILLVGGGLLLTLYCRFLPFRRLGHGLAILGGRYDNKNDPGEVTHFQALSTALASTIGMGNIGGVALGITQGGPGAVFWMWVTAVVGMATKFFCCTLAVLYRGKDNHGVAQGGPMYYMVEGLGRPFRLMAIMFSVCGMVGCLTLFQSNQMAEVMEATLQWPRWFTGVLSTAIVAVIVLGGLGRIADVASRTVPIMCVLYLVLAGAVLWVHRAVIPDVMAQIFHDAFTGTAALGGATAIPFFTVLQTGIKRAAFSNEAGIGTAPMAHGAARTSEPIREGLVAMVGPFVDTVIVCTLTALVILTSGGWRGLDDVKGVALTVTAFEGALGSAGKYGLIVVVAMFALTTMFGYSYYGRKCFSFLFSVDRARIYEVIYLGALFLGAIWSARLVVNILDTAFALMAWPNMIAVILLARRVMVELRGYEQRQFGPASRAK
jgi:AGCS family alanine or glycine:cation symporter